MWISGDTVLYDGVRSVAGRWDIDVALIHLGGVQFPVTGPFRYTMTGRDAVELVGLVKPRVAVPIHYEGWKHFKQGREGIERELAAAPHRRPRPLPLGPDRRADRVLAAEARGLPGVPQLPARCFATCTPNTCDAARPCWRSAASGWARRSASARC